MTLPVVDYNVINHSSTAINVVIVINAPSVHRLRRGVRRKRASAPPHQGHSSTADEISALQCPHETSESFILRLVATMVVLDPDRPYAQLSEREPARMGPNDSAETVDISTIFLTASRCPVNCTMCDLHQFTLDVPTTPGSIERQIRYAQATLSPSRWVKLYNSGNFFDPSSIPPQDYAAIARRCDRYDRVIVENHPRFGRKGHHVFRDLLTARLEIAVGLETVQPRMLGRIGKQMSRDDFDRYATFLKKSDIDLRVFLIVGAPGIGVTEALRWARLSIRHAMLQSARHISLIPARSGNGWGGSGKTLPTIGPDALADLLRLGLSDVNQACCLSVDLWDIANQASTAEEHDLIHQIERSVMTQDPNHL